MSTTQDQLKEATLEIGQEIIRRESKIQLESMKLALARFELEELKCKREIERLRREQEIQRKAISEKEAEMVGLPKEAK